MPLILKILVLTLVLPIALVWLASAAGVAGIALKARWRRWAGGRHG